MQTGGLKVFTLDTFQKLDRYRSASVQYEHAGRAWSYRQRIVSAGKAQPVMKASKLVQIMGEATKATVDWHLREKGSIKRRAVEPNHMGPQLASEPLLLPIGRHGEDGNVGWKRGNHSKQVYEAATKTEWDTLPLLLHSLMSI